MTASALARRVTTLLLGLCYMLAWGAPVAIDPCPMHDGTGTAMVMPMPVAAAVGEMAMGPAAGSAHGDLGAHQGSHDRHGAHNCTCMGHGCCATTPALPTAQQRRWFAAVTRRAATEPAGTSETAAASAPRLIPYATGPPGAPTRLV